ncbi:MAG: DUF5906 domain-containing protein [Anaerorhabdus sp.]|uniref:DUF5906 domain-containing protein n=1 Tax=Anaerorhabdus sp. TaxID=1872524 RepID=UPI002FC9775B
MDFTRTIAQDQTSPNRTCDIKIYPDYKYKGVKDIVTKGKAFYAFWNGTNWDTNNDNLIGAIDANSFAEKKRLEALDPHKRIKVMMLNSHSSNMMKDFLSYQKQLTTKNPVFNTKVMFASDKVKREDYSTNKLPYDLEEGPTPAFDEMMGVLYEENQLDKILWFMGILLSNNASKVQKFMFLYGGKGSGKGTVINIFKMLFEGYHEPIDLNLLTGNSEFATSQVKEVPLLIDDDTDISKITKDTNLLKLTSHEPMHINIKFKDPYDTQFMGLLITASNQRFKVRNVDSGITRRAVVVEPTEKTLSRSKYMKLYDQIKFEIPMIANKAVERFNEMGFAYYDDFIDVDMLEATDLIFSFVSEYEDQLGDEVNLKDVAKLYKMYLEDLDFDTAGSKRRIKEELKRYYRQFITEIRIDGVKHRNVYRGFKREIIHPEGHKPREIPVETTNNLTATHSLLDDMYAEQPAQLANVHGVPSVSWDKCTVKLKDIDTSKLHYVVPGDNHIVIDFDIKNEKGEKDLAANIKAAAHFPETYQEVSKSGGGLHLHYIYSGDVSKLAPDYDKDIEIKTFKGKSSLRRMVTKCNDIPVRTLSTGLPQKKEGNDLNEQVEIISWNEKKLRTTIKKNLNKEYHSATKPSIDFIKATVDQAEADGVLYDINDMRPAIIAFAAQSSNHASYCLKIVNKLNYCTIVENEPLPTINGQSNIVEDKDITFFDVEVFPNLFIVVWMDYNGEPVTWINPTPAQMGELLKKNLVGFNNRGYDNHIIVARWNGETNEELYKRSKLIISKDTDRWAGTIRTAGEMSYADIYEYSTDKKSLKKWEVDLGIKHDELEFDFDKPLPEEHWPRAAGYCSNDVRATKEVFIATQSDYVARKILATLSGLPVNSTNKMHSEKFMFGDDPRPQDKFVYTDLSKEFPGYKYDPFATKTPKSTYFGEDTSDGGYVYSEPGVYGDVALLDIVSLHPSSAIIMDYFGEYTPRYADLLKVRVLIKNKKYDEAAKMFDGVLSPFLKDKTTAKSLSYALKIIINIVYGLSSASFDNKFKHKDNVDNIIAKRGALFMMTLKKNVQEMGYTVAHIKTDSIKIPNADQEIIDYVFWFGKQYGYEFDHEHTYKRMALVNKAVYIAEYEDEETGENVWEPTGAQFADPIVLKSLFTHEPIVEEDYATMKQAKTPIYLGETFIGKNAHVYASLTGQELMKGDGDKRDCVVGTKGFKWELMANYKGKQDLDMEYYDGLVTKAIEAIDKVGSAYQIIDSPPNLHVEDMLPF